MAFIFLDSAANPIKLKAIGQWNKNTATIIEEEIAKFKNTGALPAVIDLHDVTAMDTSGALMIYKLRDYLECSLQRSIAILYGAADISWRGLLEEVGLAQRRLAEQARPPEKRPNLLYFMLNDIGQVANTVTNDVYAILYLIGSLAFSWPKKSSTRHNPHKLASRLAPFIQQLNSLGVKATPIVMLLAFIIGAIMAQQGAFQLRYFGAEIFVVDLTGILIFRELGVLITAILIAGRCGSAITAELGVMKMREEIDALQIMGFDVFKTLYLPRIAALVVSLPLLTIFANIAALAGAAVMIHYYSHISYKIFLTRIQNDIYFSTYIIGVLKSPFLALLIALVAVMEGLKIKDSTQILGQKITSCVVKSIFCVIVIDGIFAMILAWLNY